MRILARAVALVVAVAGIAYAGDSAAEAANLSGKVSNPIECLKEQGRVWDDCFPAGGDNAAPSDGTDPVANAGQEPGLRSLIIRALGILTPNPYGAVVGGHLPGGTRKFDQ